MILPLCIPTTLSANDNKTSSSLFRIANYDNLPQFGGSSSVSIQTQSDDEIKRTTFLFKGLTPYLTPYYDFKDSVKQETGLAFGFDYALLFQGANVSLGDHYALGGVGRFFGTWTLFGRGTPNTGSFVYKVENRHSVGTLVPPQNLAGEIGYIGLTSDTFSDAGWLLTNLYWLQTFSNHRYIFVAGILDVTDYVDVYGLNNPWTDFNNSTFSTNPTIPAPSQGMGVAASVMLTDNFYLLGGLADSNGNPENPGKNFDSFFNDHEYFKHIELGWVSSWQNRYLDNIHLTAWQVDFREASQTPSGWGLAFSFSRKIDERWLPFLRAGYSDGGGSPFNYSVSSGFGYFPKRRSDVMGFGFNWSRPSAHIFGNGLKDQYTFELFYRIQLFQHTTITPDIQYLVNPALNSEANSSWVFGLRTRLSF